MGLGVDKPFDDSEPTSGDEQLPPRNTASTGDALLAATAAELVAELRLIRNEIATWRRDTEARSGQPAAPSDRPHPPGVVRRWRFRRGGPAPELPDLAVPFALLPDPVETSTTRGPWVAVLLLGLALAAIGQWCLTTGRAALELKPAWREPLQPVWPNPDPVVTAIALFLAALACCAVSLQIRPGGRWQARAARRWSARRPSDLAAPVCLAVGGLVFAWTIVRLATTEYQPSYPRWYLLGLGLLLAGLARSERRLLRPRLRGAVTRVGLLEATLVAALVAVFLWLSVHDVRDWRYASIGDEHSFFKFARRIANREETVNLFSDRGVYDTHPVLSTFVTGTLMRVLGTDVVGWKLATNVPVALALVFTFLLARTLYGRTVAFLTLAMLASAHYLLAFAHIGYNNLEPLLGTAAGLWLFVVAERHRSTTLRALSGAMAGLGWYTFYSGRTTIAILALAVLLTTPWRRWLRIGSVIGAGFAALLLPMAVVNGRGMIDRMLRESSANPEGPARGEATRLLINAGRSLLAFNHNTHRSHFVSGSLVEPATAALFVVGLGIAVATWHDPRSRLLLVWLGVGVVATGVASKYDHVTITRMHFVLPAVALLAAVAAERLLAAGLLAVGPRWRTATGAVAVAALAGLVTAGNLHRFYVVTPGVTPVKSTAVVMGIIQEPACLDAAAPPLVLTENDDNVLRLVVEENGRVAPPEIVRYADAPVWVEAVAGRCVIMGRPHEPEAQPVIDLLAARWPGRASTEVTDGSGETRILVWYPTIP